MKKILISIAILGGLAAESPLLAQRANPIDKAEYKHDRSARMGQDRDGHHRDRAGIRNRPAKRGHSYKARQHRRHHKHLRGKHGVRKGHARKAAPRGAPRGMRRH